MLKKKNEYIADFETQKNPKDNKMSVWSWAVCSVDNCENIEYGNSIYSFLEYLKQLPNCSRVGFHNLKYDSSFLLNTLIGELDYKVAKSKDEVKKHTIMCLISSTGIHYSYDIYFTKTKHIHLFDTLKLFNMSVEKVAKSFDLPIKKGEIDYIKFRGYNYKMTDEEKDYIKNDVQIVALALKQFRQQGFKNDTIASCALRFYKENYYKNDFKFYKTFPHIEDIDYENMKHSYRGGYVYANPKFKNKPIKNGIVLDVNSLYPYVMSNPDILLPVGEPIKFDGKYEEDIYNPLYIQFFSVCFELKKNKIPTIQVKGNSYGFSNTEYITSSKGMMINLCLTSVDLEMFYECYDIIEIKFFGGYKFFGKKNVFTDYVNHFTEMKINATITGNKGLRQIAKLLLNSLYGKFGANNNAYVKIPYIDEKNKLNFEVVKSQKPPKTLYLPIASFITANARKIIQRAYIDNIERCCYCDTDSLHLIGDKLPSKLKIDDTELGAFKKELVFNRAKFLGAKCYIEEFKNSKNEFEIKVTCAGLPQKPEILKQITYENFTYGTIYNGVLKSRQAVGGIDLRLSEFELKER